MLENERNTLAHYGEVWRDKASPEELQCNFEQLRKLWDAARTRPDIEKATLAAHLFGYQLRLGSTPDMQRALARWLEIISGDPGFRPFFTECVHNMLQPIKVMRTSRFESYVAIADTVMQVAMQIEPEIRIEGGLHSRHSILCPWLMFRVCCQDKPGDYFSIDGLSADTAFRRCFFAASLMGMLHDLISVTPNPNHIWQRDIMLQQHDLTPADLAALKQEISRAAATTWTQLSPEKRKVYDRHHLILIEWLK